MHLNGRLTLGENTADNGGVRVAYLALQKALGTGPRPAIDGFTPEQRFFLGFAGVWCQNITDAAARQRAQTDPHSSGQFRVIGPLSNAPEFAHASAARRASRVARTPAPQRPGARQSIARPRLERIANLVFPR